MTMRRMLPAALLLAALAATATQAQFPAPVAPLPGGPGVPPSLPYFEDEPSLFVTTLLRGAGLSSEQSHRVHRILGERKDALRSARREVRAAQDALADRMTAPGTLATKDVAPQIDRLARAHRAQIDEIVATALAVRDVLDAEQVARAARWTSRLRHVRNELQDLTDPEDATKP